MFASASLHFDGFVTESYSLSHLPERLTTHTHNETKCLISPSHLGAQRRQTRHRQTARQPAPPFGEFATREHFCESKHNDTNDDDDDDALSRHSHSVCAAIARSRTCGKGDPAPSCSLPYLCGSYSWKIGTVLLLGAANAVSDVGGLQNMWVPKVLFGYRKRVYQVNPGQAFVRVSSLHG